METGVVSRSPVSTGASTRVQNEILHGKRLAQGDPDGIWGWGTPAGRVRARRRAELIAQGAGLGAGVRALEIGCGTGLFTEIFARTGAHIVAVDISSELLALARQRGLPAERVQFLEKRFEACDVDGPFDAVIGSSVLHHLELGPALGRIRELLRPGGRVCFTEPNMLNPQILLQKNVPWLKRRLGDSPDESAFFRWSFARLLRRAGFREVRITPFDWLHPATPEAWIPAVQRWGFALERVPMARELAGSLVIQGRRP